jgi:thiol-disulfide isomerase/thioredoxin
MSQSDSSRNILWLVLLGAAAVVGSVWLSQQVRGPAAASSLAMPPGTVAPAVDGEGWLNGKELPPKAFEGKVTVLQAFAYWCGPCAAEADHLAELHKRYGDKVQFLGMTGEGGNRLNETNNFLESHGVTWPVAYGAGETLEAWGVEFLPSVWIIGRDGTIAWSDGMAEPIEEALEKVLHAPSP